MDSCQESKGDEEMKGLRRRYNTVRDVLNEAWYFCPICFFISGFLTFLIVVTFIHLNGFLTPNQFSIVVIAGVLSIVVIAEVLALICLLGGFMRTEQPEKKVRVSKE